MLVCCCLNVSYSLPLFTSLLLPRMHHPSYCGFITIFKIWNDHCLTVLIWTLTTVLGLLHLHINIRSSLAISAKIECWCFSWICFESINQFEENCHKPIRVSYLFMTSLLSSQQNFMVLIYNSFIWFVKCISSYSCFGKLLKSILFQVIGLHYMRINYILYINHIELHY